MSYEKNCKRCKCGFDTIIPSKEFCSERCETIYNIEKCDRCADLKEERDELKLQVNTLETNSEGYARNARAEVADLKAQVERLKTDVMNHCDTVVIVEQDKDALTSRLALEKAFKLVAEEKLANYLEQNKDLKAQVKEKGIKLDIKTGQLVNAMFHIGDYKIKIAELEAQVEKYQAEIISTRNDFHTTNEANLKRYAELEAERNVLKVQVNTLETNSEGYARNARAEVADLRAKIAELRERCDKAEAKEIPHDN